MISRLDLDSSIINKNGRTCILDKWFKKVNTVHKYYDRYNLDSSIINNPGLRHHLNKHRPFITLIGEVKKNIVDRPLLEIEKIKFPINYWIVYMGFLIGVGPSLDFFYPGVTIRSEPLILLQEQNKTLKDENIIFYLHFV